MAAWKALAAFAVVVAGAVAAFAIYTFGWHENGRGPSTHSPGALTPKRFTALAGSKRLYTIREGDVMRFPGTATLCQATGEAGQPQLFCTDLRENRFQVVLTQYGVQVYDLRPPNDGFVSDFSLTKDGGTHRVFTLRDGDVVRRPEAATECGAYREGAFPNLHCTRIGGGRGSVVFYKDSVQVYGPKSEPFEPTFTVRWRPKR